MKGVWHSSLNLVSQASFGSRASVDLFLLSAGNVAAARIKVVERGARRATTAKATKKALGSQSRVCSEEHLLFNCV